MSRPSHAPAGSSSGPSLPRSGLNIPGSSLEAGRGDRSAVGGQIHGARAGCHAPRGSPVPRRNGASWPRRFWSRQDLRSHWHFLGRGPVGQARGIRSEPGAGTGPATGTPEPASERGLPARPPPGPQAPVPALQCTWPGSVLVRSQPVTQKQPRQPTAVGTGHTYESACSVQRNMCVTSRAQVSWEVWSGSFSSASTETTEPPSGVGGEEVQEWFQP